MRTGPGISPGTSEIEDFLFPELLSGQKTSQDLWLLSCHQGKEWYQHRRHGDEEGKAQGSRQHVVPGPSSNNLINHNFSDTRGDHFSLWLYPLWVGHCAVLSHSVLSDSLQPHGLQPTRPLCPRTFPGKNTGVVAMPSSRGSSQPRDWTQVYHIAGKFFIIWATREALVGLPLWWAKMCLPKFIGCSSNPQYFRMWLDLEIWTFRERW